MLVLWAEGWAGDLQRSHQDFCESKEVTYVICYSAEVFTLSTKIPMQLTRFCSVCDWPFQTQLTKTCNSCLAVKRLSPTRLVQNCRCVLTLQPCLQGLWKLQKCLRCCANALLLIFPEENESSRKILSIRSWFWSTVQKKEIAFASDDSTMFSDVKVRTKAGANPMTLFHCVRIPLIVPVGRS